LKDSNFYGKRHVWDLKSKAHLTTIKDLEIVF
jgi:hypothetical protein